MPRSSSSSSSALKRQARKKRENAYTADTYSGYTDPKRKGDKSTKKASELLLERQLEIPLYLLGAILVCHALSGTSSLSLAHLSAHLPHSIQRLLPAWAKRLPNLAPFASDVPNASHDSKSLLLSSAGATWSQVVGQAGPFRSDAAGFGHPLTALHTFTRACLGLSYALPSQNQPAEHLRSFFDSVDPRSRPEAWAWLWGQPNTLYGKGLKDALYVMTWVLIWTALRAAFIRFILSPLGSRWVAKPPPTSTSHRLRQRKVWEKNITRFAERSWSVIFYTCYWSLGLYIAYHSPYWFNTAGFWIDHPHVELEGIAKFYYLTQCAFWFHQVLVINVEARRKDHWQMFSHHIITILLITGSYFTHFTRVGNAVLCLMDPSDILLDLAKCLRYVGLQTICDVAFGLFLLSWIATRHVLFCCLIWACIKIVPQITFEEARQAAHSTTAASVAQIFSSMSLKQIWEDASFARLTLVGLLVALQFILLLWFVMIVRVAYRVVTGAGATDTRSDEELDEEDELELKRVEGQTGKATSLLVGDNSRGADKALSSSTLAATGPYPHAKAGNASAPGVKRRK